MSAAKKDKQIEKPNIYDFHDYRDFLKQWLEHRSATTERFSNRRLAKISGLASGYIPMILSGKRNLSERALTKIESFLNLTPSDLSYFRHLVILSDSNSQTERLNSLKKMQKFSNYSEKNNDEVKAYTLLTKWHNVILREMVQLKDFTADVDWIKRRLIPTTYKKEIREALSFLTKNNFLKVKKNELVQAEHQLDCIDSVYKVGLTQFHKDMFKLAAQSIDDTPSEWRSIVGHTLSVSKDQFAEIKEILDEALHKISKIENNKETNEVVYHTSLIAFPLTKLEEDKVVSIGKINLKDGTTK